MIEQQEKNTILSNELQNDLSNITVIKQLDENNVNNKSSADVINHDHDTSNEELINDNNIQVLEENNNCNEIDKVYSEKLKLIDNYGDYNRVEHAATLIQSAYRQYKLKKNYLKIYENNIKRRSLNIEKLNCLNYSLNESEAVINYKLLTPSSSSSDSGLTSTSLSSSSPPQSSTSSLKVDKEKLNENNDNIKALLISSSLALLDNKKSELVATSSEDKKIALSSDSKKQSSNIELNIEADNLIREEELDSVINLNESPKKQELITGKQQSNSCSSVHSVYSNLTVSSKCSYLSSGSSISSAKPNGEMLKLSSPQSITTNSTTISSSSIGNSERVMPKLMKANNLSSSNDIKLMIGTTLFNHTPKLGIKYLCQNKYVDISPRSIARLLLTNKLLSKQKITDYISDKDEFSKLILE